MEWPSAIAPWSCLSEASTRFEIWRFDSGEVEQYIYYYFLYVYIYIFANLNLFPSGMAFNRQQQETIIDDWKTPIKQWFYLTLCSPYSYIVHSTYIILHSDYIVFWRSSHGILAFPSRNLVDSLSGRGWLAGVAAESSMSHPKCSNSFT